MTKKWETDDYHLAALKPLLKKESIIDLIQIFNIRIPFKILATKPYELSLT